MPLVDRVRTLLTPESICYQLYAAHNGVFGVEPASNRLSTAYAHVCLETGNGEKMWHWSFGNETCWSTDPYPQFPLTTTEFEQGDGKGSVKKTLRYRAFKDASDGAAGYWRLLSGRYSTALALFDKGDEALVARELGRMRYFTATVAEYAAALTSLQKRFFKAHADLARGLDEVEHAPRTEPVTADELRRTATR